MTKGRSGVMIVLTRRAGLPWWWTQVDHGALGCRLEYEPIVVETGRPTHPFSFRFLWIWWKCLVALRRARRAGHDYVFTFECDLTSFVIAIAQTVMGARRPRHVILQFIMRERTPALMSTVKYAFMRWCFSSVYLCICSARQECRYYARVFGWRMEKVPFAIFHTDERLLEQPARSDEGFVVSAGRTFRDYPTLLRAVAGLELQVVIVASPECVAFDPIPPNVTIRFDVPLDELTALIARCSMVVLPLQDVHISIGQSVLLQAMALGKPVIASRVSGTVDYVEHMRTALLVPPNDPCMLRQAIVRLREDAALRHRLAVAGMEQVRRAHLPRHYADDVTEVLRRAGRRGAAVLDASEKTTMTPTLRR